MSQKFPNSAARKDYNTLSMQITKYTLYNPSIKSKGAW